MLVIAGAFGTTPDPDFGYLAPDDYYVVGYLGVVLAALGLTTIPVDIARERELGVTRRYRAAGIDSALRVASDIVVGVIVGAVAGAVVLAAGAAVYGLDRPVHSLRVIGWFAVGLFCFISIGVALGTTFTSSRAVNAVGNLLFVPMFLLGGGGPPPAVMPPVMRTISDLLPLRHILGGLRDAWLGTTDDTHDLWQPLAVGALCIAIALRNSRRAATNGSA